MKFLAAAVLFCALLGPSAPAQAQNAAAAPTPPGAQDVMDKPPSGYASVEVLWPEGTVPGALGTRGDDVPKLYSYPAAGAGAHPAVIVLPGGGYLHLVNEKEGAAEARWLNERGVSAYIPAPFPGFEAAPRTHDDVDQLSAHPDFAILSYARLTIDRAIPGTFGMESLTGQDAPQALNDELSPVMHVSKESSPSFIYATERDEKVNSLNATAFFNALQRAGVDAELHVFERGPHGTGMGENLAKTPELAVWPLLLQGWMQAHGWITKVP